MSYYRITNKVKKQRRHRIRCMKAKQRRKQNRNALNCAKYLKIPTQEFNYMDDSQKLSYFEKVIKAHDPSVKRDYSKKILSKEYKHVCKIRNTYCFFHASGSGLYTNWILFHSKKGLVYELSKTLLCDEDSYKFQSNQIDPNNPYNDFSEDENLLNLS